MRQIRGGVVVLSMALVLGVLVGNPAFAAKGGSKAAKAPSEPFEKRFAAFYGYKTMDKSDWEPVEKLTGYGVEGEFWKTDWPASLLVTYFTGKSSDESGSVDIDGDGFADFDLSGQVDSTEIGIGARKWLDGGDSIAIFVEAGAVNISVDGSFKISNATPSSANGSFSTSGSTTGFWIGGGITYPISDTLTIGGIARMSQGEVDIDGVSFAGGGTLLMLTVQYYVEN